MRWLVIELRVWVILAAVAISLLLDEALRLSGHSVTLVEGSVQILDGRNLLAEFMKLICREECKI